MPPSRSVRSLLSASQISTLLQGGRTRVGTGDNPVVAFGAGFIPIIQEGLNERLRYTKGPYGPLGDYARTAHQYGGAGGSMQLKSGFFDSAGEPHYQTIDMKQGRTDVWYLNLNTRNKTQDELQNQAIIDIRRLYRIAGRSSEFDNMETSQALTEVAGIAVGGGFSALVEHPLFGEGFDVWELLRQPQLRYSNVWRRLRHIIDIIPEEHLEGGGTQDSPSPDSVKLLLARLLLPDRALHTFLGAKYERRSAEEVIGEERRTLAGLYAQYNYHAATYTNSLLSFINERLREGINRMDPSFAVTQQEGDSIAISESAVMPEEQAAGIAGAGGSPESQGLPAPIGNTGSMDYAINFMGQIHVGDVSNMGIYDDYRHGLSRGGIATRAEITEMIDAQGGDESLQGRGTLHQRIYNYYRQQAMPDWNTALREIKQVAAQTHNVAQRQLTPEQVRNPFGASTQARHGVTPRGRFRGRDPGRGVSNQGLGELSTSLTAMIRQIPSIAQAFGSQATAETAVELVNHMIGTWHQHHGNAFQSLTVRETPRITSTAFFQQYTQGRMMYLFNISAFTRDHLIVEDGYALLNMLQRTGHIVGRQVDDTIFQMKAAELARKLKGGRDTITVGRHNAIGGHGIVNSNRARASLSINLPDAMEQEIIDNILTQMSPPRLVGQYGGPPSRSQMLKNLVTGGMHQQHHFNKSLYYTQERYKRQGFYWPHLATMWAAPYMTRLRRS